MNKPQGRAKIQRIAAAAALLLAAIPSLDFAAPRAFAAHASSASPNVLAQELKEGDRVSGSSVLLVVHATKTFDSGELAKNSVNSHVRSARSHKFPVIYLLGGDSEEALSRYYLSYPPTHHAFTEGGDHEIAIDSQRILVAGGYFNLCAGEAVRDAILSFPSPGTIRIAYLADAIYTGHWDRKGERIIRNSTLKADLEPLSNREMMKYLKQNYFRDGELGLQPKLLHSASFDRYTFRILRDGQLIGRFGAGPREVELDFLVRKVP